MLKECEESIPRKKVAATVEAKPYSGSVTPKNLSQNQSDVKPNNTPVVRPVDVPQSSAIANPDDTSTNAKDVLQSKSDATPSSASSSAKQMKDLQSKADLKPEDTFLATQKPKPQEKQTESMFVKPNVIPNRDEEYILITGPIYIPKSLLKFSADVDKASSKDATDTYSMLHSRADNIKHPTSFASSYPSDERSNTSRQNPVVIDPQAFKTLPKVLQVKDAYSVADASTRSEGFSLGGSVLLKE